MHSTTYIDFLKSNNSEQFNALHQANCNTQISLKQENLSHLFITNFNLININFFDSIVEDCYFKYVNFWASDFSNVKFIKCYFISCCFGAPELINANMGALMPFIFQSPVFSNTKFLKAKILNTSFRASHLQNTLFDKCIIEKSDFRNTNLPKKQDINSNWLNNLT